METKNIQYDFTKANEFLNKNIPLDALKKDLVDLAFHRVLYAGDETADVLTDDIETIDVFRCFLDCIQPFK